MATLPVADRRVAELQEALRIVLGASTRLKRTMRDLAGIDEALHRACEAIHNAKLCDHGKGGDDA